MPINCKPLMSFQAHPITCDYLANIAFYVKAKNVDLFIIFI